MKKEKNKQKSWKRERVEGKSGKENFKKKQKESDVDYQTDKENLLATRFWYMLE